MSVDWGVMDLRQDLFEEQLWFLKLMYRSSTNPALST